MEKLFYVIFKLTTPNLKKKTFNVKSWDILLQFSCISIMDYFYDKRVIGSIMICVLKFYDSFFFLKIIMLYLIVDL